MQLPLSAAHPTRVLSLKDWISSPARQLASHPTFGNVFYNSDGPADFHLFGFVVLRVFTSGAGSRETVSI
jgi:hypothetical protein